MIRINATNLIKNKEVRKVLKDNINTSIKKGLSFGVEIEKPKHNSFMLMGTMADYLFRKILEIKFSIDSDEELICEKGLEIAHNPPKGLFYEFDEIIDFFGPSIDKYKEAKELDDELFDDIVNISMLDSLYRQGTLNYPDNRELVIKDLKSLVNNMIIIIDKIKPNDINLNPTLGKVVSSQMLIMADADLIIDKCIYEIKTSIANDIKLEYLLQLVMYAILCNLNGIEVDSVAVLNTRSTEVFKFSLNDLLNNNDIEDLTNQVLEVAHNNIY